MMKDSIKKNIEALWGKSTEGVRYFFSPGRVNLIGEHTDYNQGHVFPCTLSLGTYCGVRKNSINRMRVYSINYPEDGTCEFNYKAIDHLEDDGWAIYVKGVIKSLTDEGHNLLWGFDIVVHGNIPSGAGLSSSASLGLLMAYAMVELNNLEIETMDLVKLCVEAENSFVGVKCGVLDQFAIGFGKVDEGILLNCKTMDYEYFPLNLGEYKLVIGNTNQKRSLVTSSYNQRREECEMALKELKKSMTLKSLCDLSMEEFHNNKNLIKSDRLKKRVRHVVSENMRTLEAVTALKCEDITRFGQLLIESHVSLRDDYEVTGHALDTLVSQAWQHPATLGARMTGAGFGGCTINLVEETMVSDFISSVGKAYFGIMGWQADFYQVQVGSGPVEVWEV